MEARTFREAYGVLQEHAETLREQTEPNIDDLLSIVTESVAAYKICRARIDAVEKALQAALTDVGGGAQPSDDGGDGSEPAPRRAQARPAARKPGTGLDEMDDDVPF
jgi:exodeoxyribonuclease VII small subunit